MTFIDQYGLVPYKPWQLARYSREGACEACGASSDDVAARYAEDGYRAAACSVRLNFDHCHAHGWIRGRLCTACNTEMSTAVRVGWLHRSPRREVFLAHLGKCPDCSPA
ncbi:endonuclease domain-containing protein [Streptomyces sp. NBC_01506]|uniref:endonuclease domain-containing protein n=1 Tax=Streptomyces sp. NBC_01506 TaxID=2903887 RepID=UPI002F913A9C